jgi:protein gp37
VHPQELAAPHRWRQSRRVFVNSMSDLFHPDVPDWFIVSVFETMATASQHEYQVLTKRPQRMARLLGSDAWPRSLDALPNVWLGTSIESDRYTFRAEHLRATPAAVRFVSLEPLLGALPSMSFAGIDWAIVGGESGHNARPMQLGWVRDLKRRAQSAGAAFFVKQLGTTWSVKNGHGRSHGTDWEQWPSDLRQRAYPVTGVKEQLAV